MNQKEFLEIIYQKRSTVFLNPRVFGMSYAPDVFKYRDDQLNKLATYCSCIADDVAPKNLLLKGGNATGKTTTIIRFIEMLEKTFTNVDVVYINCQMDNTPHAVYGEIYSRICNPNGAIIGNTNKNLFNKIIENLKETNKMLIICLDDFDRFNQKEGLNDMLYKFLRIHEVEPEVQISIFTISNNENFYFDSDVRTIFNRIPIVFKDYTRDEMYGILKDRCKYGFRPDVISDDLIMEVAKIAYDYGDVRRGLALLSRAGSEADIAGSAKITKDFL